MKKRVIAQNVLISVVALLLIGGTLFVVSNPAEAASCSVPGTDNGIVTMTSSVASSGSYRIWTRMAAPNSTDNSFLLEVDGTTCFTVGGSSVPTYSNGSTTRFQAGTANWISTTPSGTSVDINLASGSHTLKLIGTSVGVVVDRVIITADTSCVPIDYGNNCANSHIAADINEDSNVNFIDFSILADKYSQTGGSLGRADINSDGTINFLDYSSLANRYGE